MSSTVSSPRTSISSCSVSSEIKENAAVTIFTMALPPDPAVDSALPARASSSAPHFFRRRVVLTAAQEQRPPTLPSTKRSLLRAFVRAPRSKVPAHPALCTAW